MRDTTHELKTINPHFAEVWLGHKTFEFRVNDRDFRKGDTLYLREWEDDDYYTGRAVRAKVTHILKYDPDTPLGVGQCIMSLEVFEQEEE